MILSSLEYMRPGRYDSLICIGTGNFSQSQLNLALAPKHHLEYHSLQENASENICARKYCFVKTFLFSSRKGIVFMIFLKKQAAAVLWS
jgi:hypothetical protein